MKRHPSIRVSFCHVSIGVSFCHPPSDCHSEEQPLATKNPAEDRRGKAAQRSPPSVQVRKHRTVAIRSASSGFFDFAQNDRTLF